MKPHKTPIAIIAALPIDVLADIGAHTPLPAALYLFGSALVLLGMIFRNKK